MPVCHCRPSIPSPQDVDVRCDEDHVGLHVQEDEGARRQLWHRLGQAGGRSRRATVSTTPTHALLFAPCEGQILGTFCGCLFPSICYSHCRLIPSTPPPPTSTTTTSLNNSAINNGPTSHNYTAVAPDNIELCMLAGISRQVLRRAAPTPPAGTASLVTRILGPIASTRCPWPTPTVQHQRPPRARHLKGNWIWTHPMNRIERYRHSRLEYSPIQFIKLRPFSNGIDALWVHYLVVPLLTSL